MDVDHDDDVSKFIRVATAVFLGVSTNASHRQTLLVGIAGHLIGRVLGNLCNHCNPEPK